MTNPRMARLMSISEMKELDIFGVGNSLIDIIADVDEDFLKEYNLPKNNAILADIQHENLYDDVMNKYDIEYSPGGSVQNALRYCEWIVGKNNSVATFIGSVGNDYFGKILAKKVKLDGLNVKYMTSDDTNTGLCAVLFTEKGKHKSICANLGASKLLDKNFLLSNFWFCEKARVVFTEGHMIPVSADIVSYLAKYAHEWGKDFIFNMGAPYVAHNCSSFLIELFQYIDFVFASADEAIAFATMKGYHTKEVSKVAKLMADEPKIRYDNPRISNQYKSGRIVIITQGDKPVLLASSKSLEVKEFPVIPVKEELIKDTSGAGDAFIGGFLAIYITGLSLEHCIKCGLYCASECIQLSGCTLPKQMNYTPPNV